MTSQYRHRRTSNPATAFPNPLEPGEISVNTANRQIAVGDAASATLGAPLGLLPIRYFDTRAIYASTEMVVIGGNIQRALVANGPGAFNQTQWTAIAGILDPRYVQKLGDTMTGMLVLPATAPTLGTHATNKTYVDTAVATKSAVLVSDTPPAGAPDNTLWWESDTGTLYIRFNDGVGTPQWVIASPQPDSSMFVQRTGDTMSGALNVPAPTAGGNATNKTYVDAALAAKAPIADPYFTGTLHIDGRNFALSTGANGFTQLYNGSNTAALVLGGTTDPTNYHRNTNHNFVSADGSKLFAQISDGSVGVARDFTCSTGNMFTYGWGGNVNQGVVRFKQDTQAYIYYDGTNFNFGGGAVYNAGGRFVGTNEFPWSASGTGYQKLPTGLIIQWGYQGTGGDGWTFFPVVFPTAIYSAVVTPLAGGGLPGTSLLGYTLQTLNRDAMLMNTRYANSGGAVGVATQAFHWMAVGA